MLHEYDLMDEFDESPLEELALRMLDMRTYRGMAEGNLFADPWFLFSSTALVLLLCRFLCSRPSTSVLMNAELSGNVLMTGAGSLWNKQPQQAFMSKDSFHTGQLTLALADIASVTNEEGTVRIQCFSPKRSMIGTESRPHTVHSFQPTSAPTAADWACSLSRAALGELHQQPLDLLVLLNPISGTTPLRPSLTQYL